MKKAAVVINLGSPKSTDVKDVKEYLGEFLMDDHVIDFPKWARTLLVKGIILNTRPKKSAEAYKTIWWDEGSPLIVLSQRLIAKVRKHTKIPTYLAMRYAEPSIQQTLKVMTEEIPNLEELYVVPLYPHFAMSSYETVVDRVKEVAAKDFPELKLTFKEPWYDDDDYIKVLSSIIKETLPEDHHLMFSYHGIPVRHVKKSDCTGQHCYKVNDCCSVASKAHKLCYKHQTAVTTKLVAAELGLEEGTYETSYQSRLGRDPWIQPYTAQRFEELAGEGKKKLAVVCPAFVSDCLETLEEINEEGKEDFLHNGGEHFQPIACMNDRDDWSALLGKWISEWKI